MKPLTKAGWITLCIGGLLLIAVFLASRPGKGGHSPTLSFNVGKTESHNNTFSSTTSSASENATFNARRMMFVQTDSGQFSERIADLVVVRLTNCPLIEHLEIVKPSATIPEGIEAPDLFVRINVVNVDHSGIVSSTIKATVEGSLGVAPWQSAHHTQDRATPPVVQFAWNTTVEHESKFSGVRSDRYGETVRSIADEFVKGISNQLVTLSGKYPSLPELPRVFYGPYQPVSDFDFLKEVKGKRALSYCGVFSHNETFWEFQTATNPVPQLQRIIDQLVAAQWKLGNASLTNTMDQSVQLHQGDVMLEIFRQDRPGFLPERKDEFARFVLHYHKPFSSAEVEAATETLFSAQPSLEMLLPFQNTFSSSQRERFYALLEKAPATNPLTCLQLAELYLNRKQTNTAMNMLVRAKALMVAANDPSDLTSKIDSIAKKISPKNTLKVEVTPEVCRELGFLEVTNSPQHFAVERELGKPVLWFGHGDQGVVTSALLVRPPRRGICDWKFNQAEGYGRSSQWSSFDVTKQDTWRQTFGLNRHIVTVAARMLPDGKRMAFTFDAVEQPPAIAEIRN